MNKFSSAKMGVPFSLASAAIFTEAKAVGGVITAICKSLARTHQLASVQSVKQFSLYPNPFRDNFMINASERGTVELFTAIGEIVFATKINSSHRFFNLKKLAVGVYFVKFNGEKCVQKK